MRKIKKKEKKKDKKVTTKNNYDKKYHLPFETVRSLDLKEGKTVFISLQQATRSFLGEYKTQQP